MDKQVFYLRNSQIRQHLKNFIDTLPLDQLKPFEIEILHPRRTLSQNRKMWPLLHDLAEQGVKFSEGTQRRIEWAKRWGEESKRK